MIYNLAEFLRSKFPTIPVYTDTREKDSSGDIPDNNILIRETGGEARRVIDVPTYQIIIRDCSTPAARKTAFLVNDYLTSTAKIGGSFGLVLPAATVAGDTFPEIQTCQISALALPQSLGRDDNDRTEFVQNFQVYIKE